MMRVLGLRLTRRLPLKLPIAAEAARGIALQRVGRKIDRTGRSLAAEFRTPVKIQIPNHLQGQKIALQNLHVGFKFGGIEIVETEGGGVLEVQTGIGLVDFNGAVGFVDFGHFQAGDRDHRKNRHQASEDDPLALA